MISPLFCFLSLLGHPRTSPPPYTHPIILLIAIHCLRILARATGRFCIASAAACRSGFGAAFSSVGINLRVQIAYWKREGRRQKSWRRRLASPPIGHLSLLALYYRL